MTVLDLEGALDIVGPAAESDSLMAGAEVTNPNVIVTDTLLPRDFFRAGIEAPKLAFLLVVTGSGVGS